MPLTCGHGESDNRESRSLIVGERDLSNVDINGKSSFANKFSNFWFTVQTGKKLKDTQTDTEYIL